MSKQSKKTKPWVRTRHKIITALATPILTWLCNRRYDMQCDKFESDMQCVILYNHQTAYDQFFVGKSFGRALYYVATEDIFSLGFLSRLLEFAVGPIPIKKAARDIKAIKHCLQVVKEGGSICIAPDGNRTISGHTCYIKPAMAALVQKLGLPLVIYRIDGGYGVDPRWCDEVRKGKIHGYVRNIIQPEDYKKLSKDEFIELIRRETYVDEGVPGGNYPSPKAAEYMERAFYTCPNCGLTVWRSSGETATCQTCGGKIRYKANKEIEAVSGFEAKGGFPYKGTSEWYGAQEDFIKSLDLTKYTEQPMFEDKIKLSRVIPYKHKVPMEDGVKVQLYGDRVEIETSKETIVCDFKEVKAAACLGRTKLNIYYKDDVYQFEGDSRFNALKYVHAYYHYDAIMKGETDDEFLGL